jgi:hypothetical protein
MTKDHRTAGGGMDANDIVDRSNARDATSERLAFLDRPSVTIRLRYPFLLQGVAIETIEVRRLTMADLLHLAATDGDLFDAYGLMTSLDPTVLRGLDAEDGDDVAATAHALLPAILLG